MMKGREEKRKRRFTYCSAMYSKFYATFDGITLEYIENEIEHTFALWKLERFSILNTALLDIWVLLLGKK